MGCGAHHRATASPGSALPPSHWFADPSRAGTLRAWEVDEYLGVDGSLATGRPILAWRHA